MDEGGENVIFSGWLNYYNNRGEKEAWAALTYILTPLPANQSEAVFEGPPNNRHCILFAKHMHAAGVY